MSAALAQILADLDRHRHAFDLDRNGLGEALMDIDAECILRAMDSEVDFNDRRWPELSDEYAEWKSRHFPGQPMAVLYGRMKTIEQLKGERRVTAHTAVMVYGVDEEARSLATYFQEGNARQPERRFYGLSAEADARKDEHCRQHLESLT